MYHHAGEGPSQYMMEQSHDAVPSRTQVKAMLRLGSETYSVNAIEGLLSEQLVSMKEESMRILKDFITQHNVPNDIPDEAVEEGSSEEDGEEIEMPPERSKRQK